VFNGLNSILLQKLPPAVTAQIGLVVYKKSLFSREVVTYAREFQQHCSYRAAAEVHQVLHATNRLLHEAAHLMIIKSRQSRGKWRYSLFLLSISIQVFSRFNA
jgi:hypothetical protein